MSTDPGLSSILQRFCGARVLVVGDLMLDEYLEGEITRLSPEAPVPVVEVRRAWSRLGGAANVANCLAALGAHVSLCGAVGADAAGDALIAACAAAGIDTGGVLRIAGRTTTRKLRVIGRHQQLVRLDWERVEPVDTAAASAAIAAHGPADAVVVSDYAKGFIHAGTFAAVRAVGAPILVDPKGRDFSIYAGATVITPNQKELELATSAGDIEARARAVAALGIPSVVVTLGERGLFVLPEEGASSWIHAEPRAVFDVTGAGDTVIALLALGVATGMSLVEAARLANTAAGIVVGKVGTAVVDRHELAAAVAAAGVHHGDPGPDSVLARVRRWRAEGRRIVFTNGCFDVLHAGHLSILRFAKAQGDVLIVGINTDASVRRLKGATRPVVPEAERAALVEALGCVDAVALFDEDTPLRLIQELVPDVLVKGADYTLDRVVGRDVVEAAGGRVALAPLLPGHSTSRLIELLTRG